MDTASLTAILSLPPEQLAAIPAGIPPDGVQPNFENPRSDAYIYHTIAGVMIPFMFAFLAMRYHVKFFVWRSTTVDDWITLAAVFFLLAYFAAYTYVIVHVGFGVHMWNLSVLRVLDKRFHIATSFALWLPIVASALIKDSFFIMYLRIFKPFQFVRWAVFLGLLVNNVVYIVFVGLILSYNTPRTGQSWLEVYIGTGWRQSLALSVPIVAFGLALDIYIFLIPSTAVWKLQLTKQPGPSFFLG